MKMLNKIFFLFFINCIFVFPVESNNFNSEKLGENIILEVREISLNGGERRKIYFIINQKNEIEVLGTTKEELNRKIKKKINFHDPRFYMVRFGGIIVED